MNVVYFTIVAIILYFAADWLLERVETAAGRRLEHRSLVFFAILLTLALSSFSLIQYYTGGA
jgi:Ca2+/Na+ antiporter